MARLSRERGRTYEIEVAKAFSAHFGREFKRKLGQARDSGNDLDVGPLVIECKRTRGLGRIYGWLKQAILATADRKYPVVPVVVTREDEGKSIVIMQLCDFLELCEPRVRAYFAEHPE